MLYMAIGGVPLMFLYKGINTMDSMLGYKNDKYLYFGRVAAKLDDVANYIPARISGWLMVAGTVFTGMDIKTRQRSTNVTGEIMQAPTQPDRGCHGRSAGCTACGKCILFWKII